MDDLERAILYSFDETGAVAPELKVLCCGNAAHSDSQAARINAFRLIPT